MNESSLKKHIGAGIKELRIKKGAAQESPAEKIAVGERNLSRIECGEIFFKLKTPAGLINALEIEPNELFDFSASQENSELKEVLIDAVKEDKADVNLLYRIYRSIKY